MRTPDLSRPRQTRTTRLAVLGALLLVCAGVASMRALGAGKAPGAAPGATRHASVVAVTTPRPMAAPAFSLATIDGGRVDLASLRGRPVMVNFWATWCAPCKRELPVLRAAFDAHKQTGLVIVGVLVDDTAASASPFGRAHGITWPVAVDPGSRTRIAYGAQGVPTTVLIDRQGRIVDRRFGAQHAPELEAALAKILA